MGQGNPNAQPQAIKVSEDQLYADLGREHAAFLEVQRANKGLFDENQQLVQIIQSGQQEIARLRGLLTGLGVPEDEINGTPLAPAPAPNRAQRRAAARAPKLKAVPPEG